MTHVGKITAEIKTGDITNAPTNGRVYLGIGGREIRLDKSGNHFTRGALDTFIIGDGGNIENPRNANELPYFQGTVNCPRLEFSDLGKFPAYIRLEDDEEDDKDWNVEAVSVVAVKYDFGAPSIPAESRSYKSGLSGHIWLGEKFGKVLHLL
jgi:hypothetical protein